MKLVVLTLAIWQLMLCDSGLTQNLDSIPQPAANQEYSEYFDNMTSFINDYQINLEESKQAKLLDDTYLLVKPLLSSENSPLKLPKGEIVTTFKYLPQAGCWAVRYKEYYGFVPTQYIMPIQDKQESFNATPYDEAPRATNRLRIKYPKDALNNGIEGVVSLKVLIDKKGVVKETEIVNGIDELNEAAIEAVKNLKFIPGKYKGKPVDVWIRIPVTFSIEAY